MRVNNNQPSFGMALKVNTTGMTPEEIGGVLLAAPVLKRKAKAFNVVISKTFDKVASPNGGVDKIPVYCVVVSKLKKSLYDMLLVILGEAPKGKAVSKPINQMTNSYVLPTNLVETVDKARARYIGRLVSEQRSLIDMPDKV